MQIVKFSAQLGYTHPLIGQGLQVHVIASASKHESACLVVCSHHYQRFIGMLLVKLICHLHGIVHIYDFGDEGRVIGMTEPVYLSSLYHQEETVLGLLLLGEEMNGGTGNVGQIQVT